MQSTTPHRRVETEVQASGLQLTPRLRREVAGEARYFAAQFQELTALLQVRLFSRGPSRDTGCLVQARVGHARQLVIATHVDADAARALRLAFMELARGTRAVLHAPLSARPARGPVTPWQAG